VVTNNLFTKLGLSANEERAERNQQLPNAPYFISFGSIFSKNTSGLLLASLRAKN